MNVSCPFCNHAFTAESASRAICPRCGESVPQRGSSGSATPVPALPIDLGERVRSRLKQSLLISMGIMLVLAGIAFWQFSQKFKQDNAPPPPVSLPAATVRAPLELRGLKYLPPNCNAVFAVQFGPLLIYAERTKQDPVALLTANRVPASLLGTLAAAGVTLQQIEHIVGGVYVPDKDEELRVGFAIVMRQRLTDEKAFLDAFRAKPQPDAGPDRFTAQVGSIGLHLFHAEEPVWVFGLSGKDVTAHGGLSAPMRELIGARLPPEAAIWVAAQGERWSEKPLAKLLPDDARNRFAKWTAFAAGYELGESPRLHVAVKTTDAASAEMMRTRFRALATGETSRTGGSDDWATLERAVDPVDLPALIARFTE